MSGESREDRRARRRGMAARREGFASARLGDFDAGLLAAAMGQLLASLPPVSRHVRRWVPIGPSVARSSGQSNYVRTTGRVRDLAVSPDGRRAYAGTGKGGLWYTEDAGQFWRPVGDAAARSANTGGPNSAKACGSILVAFGATAADDFVMVGTGESMMFSRPGRPALAGLGVLAARGPADSSLPDPWDTESGLAVMEGVSAFRLARHPAATPGAASGPSQDRVAAATTSGLFLGTRGPSGFTWALVPLPSNLYAANPRPVVTDVLWVPGPNPNGRIVVALALGLETPAAAAPLGSGVAFSDDLGATFQWVGGLASSAAAPAIQGRMSLATAAGGRVYVLGDIVPSASANNVNTIWRIPDIAAASPAATTLSAVPPVWITDPGHRSQRDYDQAIVVDVVSNPPNPDIDRLYLGGAYVELPPTTSPDGLASSLWCLDVNGSALQPAPNISRAGTPHRPAGLIGDNVHADVHCLRLATVDGVRQVWVGCDGGVFVSPQAGRANSFGPRVTGLAAFEVNFLVQHPTSSHFGAAGVQDNGRLMRVGEMVWEDTFGGDGGGVVFHPVQSQYIMAQYVFGSWDCRPLAGYADPLTRWFWPQLPPRDRENDASAFYSGPSAVKRNATSGRIALGTNRVWITDNLAAMPYNNWRVLPFATAAPAPDVDPRPAGADLMPAFGVPGGGVLGPITGGVGPFGPVLTVKWASPTELLALFEKGVVRWKQNPAGQWTADPLLTPAPLPPAPPGPPQPRLDVSVTTLTDIAPIPESQDFYLTCSGDTATPPGDTCYRFDNATRTFVPTRLRTQLPPPPGASIGPIDPAQAVTVDPTDAAHVYVGTITGVWHGERAGATVTWLPMVSNLPQAVVQDLSVWTSSDPDSPRLLRAGLQSRGVWEVDLAADQEPMRTYLRVHSFDNRRKLPTPMANPRISPLLDPLKVVESPDITVRPQVPATAPRWQFGTGVITATSNWAAVHNVPVYELWTFQTAFRWHFPSVTADGVWNDALAELISLHRANNGLGAGTRINRQLWDLVVGGTRLTSTGALSSSPGDPLAVYRAPWHSPGAMDALGTELDLMDHVHPIRPVTADRIWRVYREPSVVDVLVHHRDTVPLGIGAAKVVLFRLSASTSAALLSADGSWIPGYIASVISGGTPAVPAGWRVEPSVGPVTHPLNVELSARMPRAVSVDVNLTTERLYDYVMFVAVTFSPVDPATVAPFPALPAGGSVADLVQRWPYAAMRIVRVHDRPTGTP
ncbi:hypothetical protein [Catellatospora tritici]|uniref:hypothetical protein n=1 Tax=Catellatospora tritici TaxID=2851566 RepID=UPI001C2DC1E7|nr:hypothetical protein [Catellatospora tritici]MBV1856289.1 hypothetical protein [Catellatospora tritici]